MVKASGRTASGFHRKKSAPSSSTTKPPKTFSVMWPASILAKRRMEWLTGRDRKEMISIGTTKGMIHQGTPEGTKRRRKPKPFLMKPVTMTVVNTISASVTVMMMCVVTVNV